MNDSPLLECLGLACGYHGAAVVTGIDLEIRAGEIVALLGPNGSGKSTLLRTISGELPIVEGKVLLQGDPVCSLSEREIAMRVAVAPQEEAHRFGFTVSEVVAMGRHARSGSFFDSEEDLAATRTALAIADCSDLADRRITEVSGGEKQRALIARALAQNTPILIMDEPTSHLDVGHQIAFARLGREIAAQGRAVFAAIHDLNLAAIMADRGLLLSEGKVTADKSMGELLSDPALDAAYGVAFQRVQAADGKLRLYASL